MPPYLVHLASWQALWPLPLTAFVLSLFCFGLARPKEAKGDLLMTLTAFSMLGLVTGYLTGFSRTPAVGAVLPAVLSLVAGLAVFMLGKDSAIRAIVSLSILIFSTSLVLGTTWGASLRQEWEEYPLTLDAQKAQALMEVQVREFRQALGLPAAPPAGLEAKSDE